ncbi:MAG: hypothetical protein RR854_00440 [Muribaculaceae bacterium]
MIKMFKKWKERRLRKKIVFLLLKRRYTVDGYPEQVEYPAKNIISFIETGFVDDADTTTISE